MTNLIKIYSVYDEMTEQYKYPIFLPNDKVALYYFQKEMEKTDPQLAKEMELTYIGTFNPENGVIEPVEMPTIIGDGANYVGQKAELSKDK